MIAQVPNLNEILTHHEIDPKYWAEIRAFVEEGVPASDEVMTCFSHLPKYAAVLSEVLAELSKGVDHKFPPPDYQPPPDYPFYEPLSPEDIVPVASGGCAV